jgi:ABC-type polysaccharide/polyol phosphate export permease
LTIAVSMIVSSLNPRFRDIGIIWSVLVTVLFYATPVLYPIEAVSEELRGFIALNPLSPLFALARTWMIDPTAPGPVEAVGAGRVAIAAALYVGTCVFAAWIFKREAPRIAEEL